MKHKNEITDLWHEVDKVFKEVEKMHETVSNLHSNLNIPRKTVVGPWKPWFAWRPIKIHGQRVWLEKIFRRTINTYVDMDDWTRYEYGTLFDVIKGDE